MIGKAKPVWYLVMAVAFIVLAIVLTVKFLPGCSSQKARVNPATEEDVTAVQKSVAGMRAAIEGVGNAMTTLTNTVQSTVNILNTVQDTITQQNQQGQAVTAKDIEEIKTNIKNITNSTALVITIVAIMAVIILVMILIGSLILWRYVTQSMRLARMFAAEDNTMTPDLFKKY